MDYSLSVGLCAHKTTVLCTHVDHARLTSLSHRNPTPLHYVPLMHLLAEWVIAWQI